MRARLPNEIRSNVTFRSGSLILEGILHTTDQSGPRPAVVVCHPHPQFGGTMNNAVIALIAEELIRHNITALRFNYRGVQGSEGVYGEGIEEIGDVRAAVDYLCSLPTAQAGCAVANVNPGCIGIAGYSFGAYVTALEALADDRIKGVALVSPAFNHQDYTSFLSFARPKFILAGENDELVPSNQVIEMMERLPEPKQLELVRLANHSWWGFEKLVATKVAEFFEHLFT